MRPMPAASYPDGCQGCPKGRLAAFGAGQGHGERAGELLGHRDTQGETVDRLVEKQMMCGKDRAHHGDVGGADGDLLDGGDRRGR